MRLVRFLSSIIRPVVEKNHKSTLFKQHTPIPILYPHKVPPQNPSPKKPAISIFTDFEPDDEVAIALFAKHTHKILDKLGTITFGLPVSILLVLEIVKHNPNGGTDGIEKKKIKAEKLISAMRDSHLIHENISFEIAGGAVAQPTNPKANTLEKSTLDLAKIEKFYADSDTALHLQLCPLTNTNGLIPNGIPRFFYTGAFNVKDFHEIETMTRDDEPNKERLPTTIISGFNLMQNHGKASEYQSITEASMPELYKALKNSTTAFAVHMRKRIFEWNKAGATPEFVNSQINSKLINIVSQVPENELIFTEEEIQKHTDAVKNIKSIFGTNPTKQDIQEKLFVLSEEEKRKYFHACDKLNPKAIITKKIQDMFDKNGIIYDAIRKQLIIPEDKTLKDVGFLERYRIKAPKEAILSPETQMVLADPAVPISLLISDVPFSEHGTIIKNGKFIKLEEDLGEAHDREVALHPMDPKLHRRIMKDSERLLTELFYI